MSNHSASHHDHDNDEHDLGLSHDLAGIVARTRNHVSRRRLLTIFGAGTGALALAACGSKAASTLTTTTIGSTASPTTAAGAATTAAPATTAKATATTAAGSSSSSATTAATATADSPAATGVVPEETAGPYPGDGSNGPNVLKQSGVVRSDITTSLGTGTKAAGVPMTLKMKITKGAGGAPLVGGAVYLWHADQQGRYSMYSSGVTNETYLRGVQEADANGVVTFQTIFPGCYDGRWPHMHFEVFPTLAAAAAASPKLATSQLAMTEASSKLAYAAAGYTTSVSNLARTSLTRDMVFSDGADKETPVFTGDATKGFVATITVAVKA